MVIFAALKPVPSAQHKAPHGRSLLQSLNPTPFFTADAISSLVTTYCTFFSPSRVLAAPHPNADTLLFQRYTMQGSVQKSCYSYLFLIHPANMRPLPQQQPINKQKKEIFFIITKHCFIFSLRPYGLTQKHLSQRTKPIASCKWCYRFF